MTLLPCLTLLAALLGSNLPAYGRDAYFGTLPGKVPPTHNAPHFILWPAPACFEQASTRFIAGKPAQDCTL